MNQNHFCLAFQLDKKLGQLKTTLPIPPRYFKTASEPKICYLCSSVAWCSTLHRISCYFFSFLISVLTFSSSPPAVLSVSAVRSSVQLQARPRGPPSIRMVSFILCLLPALLATMSAQASTLTCKTCAGSADACRTAQGTCRVDKATGGCYSTAEEITLGGEKTMGFSSGCLEDYNIGIKGPITVTVGSDTHLQTNTSLCNTDNNCNSAVPEVPTGSTTKNGLQCPTCFSLSSDHCDSHITSCLGDETYCIDFAGTIQKDTEKSTFVAKGCATASTKEIKVGINLMSAFAAFTFTRAISKPAEKTPLSGASPALGKFSFALYLPGLTGLLLVKLLS